MKRFISLLFFSLAFNPALLLSQNDSLETEVKKYNKLLLESSHDTTKVQLLIKLSELTLSLKGNVSEKYAQHALKISEKIKNRKFLGRSYYNLADVYMHHYQKDLAIDNLIKGLQV